ncbi:unnamed protein product [Tenebrio molitor]|nr:unnamed protein product [Tenebrio molitor]
MNAGSNLRIIVANRAKVSLNVIAGGFGAITGCANYERFERLGRPRRSKDLPLRGFQIKLFQCKRNNRMEESDQAVKAARLRCWRKSLKIESEEF